MAGVRFHLPTYKKQKHNPGCKFLAIYVENSVEYFRERGIEFQNSALVKDSSLLIGKATPYLSIKIRSESGFADRLARAGPKYPLFRVIHKFG
jgi:hypothetical protein